MTAKPRARSRVRPIMPVNGGDEGLGRGGVAEESEAAEVESGEFEKPPIRVAKDPGAPTEQEVQEHYATHLPYRSWCPVCVKARGKEEPHKKATTSNDKPIVSMDYKELGEEIEEDDKIEMIVIKDEKTGCVSAHHCERKGATDTWAMDRVIDDIETFGHNDVILKTDGEPSMLQVQRHVKAKRAGTTIPMNPPAYNPQSNGAAERACSAGSDVPDQGLEDWISRADQGEGRHELGHHAVDDRVGPSAHQPVLGRQRRPHPVQEVDGQRQREGYRGAWRKSSGQDSPRPPVRPKAVPQDEMGGRRVGRHRQKVQ